RPAGVLEAIDLERPRQRIDEPEVSYPLRRVDRHLAGPVETTRSGRDHLADPIWGERDPDDVRDRRHALDSPPGDVWVQDVLSEMQLRLVENPPATGFASSAWWAIKAAEEIAPDGRRCPRVRCRRTRAREQLAVDDLGNEMVGHGDQVVVRGAARRGAHLHAG